MTQPIYINLHPNEYSQGFHYFSFAFKLDRCVRSCNTLNEFSIKVRASKKKKKKKSNRRFKSKRVQHNYMNK